MTIFTSGFLLMYTFWIPMVKYKEYFTRMLEENKDVFDSFAKLHLDYSLNNSEFQDKFNKEGEIILDIIRDYENRLCSNTERGKYNKYSAGLSEKFQSLVRSHFPLIDHIGLITDNPVAPKAEKLSDGFSLKKINL